MDFTEYDKQEILDRISRHCPEAMCVYLHCYNRMDMAGHVILTRKQIEEELCETWTCFKNNLKKLSRENLLTWATNVKKDHIKIIMASVDYDPRMDDEEPKKKGKVLRLMDVK